MACTECTERDSGSMTGRDIDVDVDFLSLDNREEEITTVGDGKVTWSRYGHGQLKRGRT